MYSILLFYGLMSLVRPDASRTRPTLSPHDRAASTRVRKIYGKLPLSFEANQGQADGQVRFLSRGESYSLYLTASEAVLALGEASQNANVENSEAETGNSKFEIRNWSIENRKSKIKNPRSSVGTRHSPPATAVLRMKLVGADPAPQVSGLNELPGKSNYFIGNDPSKWHTNISTYAKVRYENIYPGVDVVYYGNQERLENDYIVAPGADPTVITLAVEARLPCHPQNADVMPPLQTDASGDLVIGTDAGEARFHRPVAYQQTGDIGRRNTDDSSAKHFIDVRYVLRGDNQIGFQLGEYDSGRPLIIDPVLSFSTYLGGSNGDSGNGIAVDSSGNAYVAGGTRSLNFPTASPLQATSGGDSDVFVAKLNASGSTLIYSTYLGGNAFDQANGIALDSSGNAFITGYTASANFPTKGAFQTSYGGNGDAFVAELDPTGSALVYSSYLGGSGADFGQGIALDSSGNAYVTGSTQSTNFPTQNPLQATSGGNSDAFVSKVNPSGSALVYSTYLGGSAADSGQGIGVDASSSAYVTGFTYSTNFPTVNAHQGSIGGNSDAFVAKLNPSGSALVYSTYLGGSGFDRGFGIAIDAAGNAYVTGDTTSTNFPTTLGVLPYGGNGDAFVTALNSTGAALIYSTFLGGSDLERGTGIAVDASGNAYVTGFTLSPNFPTFDALQPTFGGGTCGTSACADAFVSKLVPQGTALTYSTYLGGSGADFGGAISIDSHGDAFVTGSTVSSNFPPTVGAFQAIYGGNGSAGEAFVAKIDPTDAPAVAVSPQPISFANQGTGSTSAPQTVTVTNAGSAPLSISSITITGTNSGDFAQTSNCPVSPATLATGGNCTVSVTFTPSATDTRTASLIITDDAAGSPHQVTITGTGATPAPAVTLSPTSLTFAAETVGSTSAPQTVTLTNSGSAALSITKIAASGDYTQSNGCGASLAVGASCTISVTFSPKGSGSRTGSVAITDNASGSPQSFSLSGTGIAAFTLSSSTTTTTLNIGTTSTTFTIAAASSSGFTSSISLNCSNTAGATCTFNPTSIKPGETSKLTLSGLTASSPNPLVFTVNGTSSSQSASLQLTIKFTDFSLSVSPPFVVVTPGQMATYTLTITPTNGFNQSVALKCSGGFFGLPVGVTCSISPVSVKPNGSTAVTATVTVKTTAASTVGERGKKPRVNPLPSGRAIWRLWAAFGAWLLALAMFATLAAYRGHHLGEFRARRFQVVLGVTLLFVVLWAACGGGKAGTSAPGTPGGNFPLILTGTFGSGSSALSRATTVILSVG